MIASSRPASREAVDRHYDELDPFYRAVWGEDLHHGLWLRGDETPEEAVQNLTERVARRARVGRGDRVCDVGCGYGGTARLLADRFGARVVGLTVSGVQLRRARSRARGHPDLDFRRADWLEGPLPAESCEAVIAIESVSHMGDKAAFFREAARVVRPGGRVVVAAWVAAEGVGGWRRRHLLEPICREGRLPGLARRSRYRSWIREAGLELLQEEDLTRGVRRTWSVCIRRMARRLLVDPETWAYLLDADHGERRFGLTVARIWLAYRVGALRYALFTTARDAGRGAASSPS